MQVEEAAQRIRGLACDLCPGEPLGEKRCIARGLRALATVGDHSNSSKRSEPGFHLYQSASRRHGRFEKRGPQSVERTRGGWNTKLHMVAASDRDGVMFALSAGNCGDAPEGRSLLRQLGPIDRPVYLLMDRAYEGDETRVLATELGYIPVVPQKAIAKILGTMISSYTNSAIRLRGFFGGSRGFAVFLPAMINLMLSFWLLFTLLLLSMPLCEHNLARLSVAPALHEMNSRWLPTDFLA